MSYSSTLFCCLDEEMGTYFYLTVTQHIQFKIFQWMYLERDFHSGESWKHQITKHKPSQSLLTFHSPVGKISSDENTFSNCSQQEKTT